MSQKKSTHGGSRPGAGRKQLADNTVSKNVTISAEWVKIIEHRSGMKFPDYARAAIESQMKADKLL